MISKEKRVITIGKKACLICQKEFQPASGAQLTCSPECKAEARAKGLTKRGPRNRGAVDPALEESPIPSPRFPGEKFFFNGQPVDPADRLPILEVPARPSPAAPMSRSQPAQTSQSSTKAPNPIPMDPSAIQGLELDLSPIENYIRFLVQKEVHQVLKLGMAEMIGDALNDKIKEAVREQIAERLKGLLQ